MRVVYIIIICGTDRCHTRSRRLQTTDRWHAMKNKLHALCLHYVLEWFTSAMLFSFFFVHPLGMCVWLAWNSHLTFGLAAPAQNHAYPSTQWSVVCRRTLETGGNNRIIVSCLWQRKKDTVTANIILSARSRHRFWWSANGQQTQSSLLRCF